MQETAMDSGPDARQEPGITSKLEGLFQRIDGIAGQLCRIEEIAGTAHPSQAVEGVESPMGSYSEWADRAEARLQDISTRLGEINQRL